MKVSGLESISSALASIDRDKRSTSVWPCGSIELGSVACKEVGASWKVEALAILGYSTGDASAVELWVRGDDEPMRN